MISQSSILTPQSSVLSSIPTLQSSTYHWKQCTDPANKLLAGRLLWGAITLLRVVNRLLWGVNRLRWCVNILLRVVSRLLWVVSRLLQCISRRLRWVSRLLWAVSWLLRRVNRLHWSLGGVSNILLRRVNRLGILDKGVNIFFWGSVGYTKEWGVNIMLWAVNILWADGSLDCSEWSVDCYEGSVYSYEQGQAFSAVLNTRIVLKAGFWLWGISRQ